MSLAGIIAFIKGFWLVQKAAGVLSWLPGIGPAAGIVSAVLGFLSAVVKAFFEGLSICFANPVVFTVVAAAFLGGLWQGVEWDKHKVEKANARYATLEKANRNAEADSKRRLEAAIRAGQEAEAQARDAAARAARAHSDANRVRAKPAASSANGGSGVSGVSTVPWWNKAFGTK